MLSVRGVSTPGAGATGGADDGDGGGFEEVPASAGVEEQDPKKRASRRGETLKEAATWVIPSTLTQQVAVVPCKVRRLTAVNTGVVCRVYAYVRLCVGGENNNGLWVGHARGCVEELWRLLLRLSWHTFARHFFSFLTLALFACDCKSYGLLICHHTSSNGSCV